MRIRFLVAAGLACAAGATASRARAAERGHSVELGPDIGVIERPAENGYGVRYGAAVAYGAHIQIPLASFLRFTAHYARTSQEVELGPGALGTSAPVQANERLRSYTIGARIQPTWNASRRLHLWVNLGVGWGIMTAPGVHVAAPVPYAVGIHSAAFVEFPFGVGGEFDIVPGWAGLTLDLTAGPVSGGLDPSRRQQAIDAAGKLFEVPSLPAFRSTWSAMLGVVAHF
jgi:hypothetical protein